MLGNRRAKVTWKGDLHVTGSNLGQGQVRLAHGTPERRQGREVINDMM